MQTNKTEGKKQDLFSRVKIAVEEKKYRIFSFCHGTKQIIDRVAKQSTVSP